MKTPFMCDSPTSMARLGNLGILRTLNNIPEQAGLASDLAEIRGYWGKFERKTPELKILRGWLLISFSLKSLLHQSHFFKVEKVTCCQLVKVNPRSGIGSKTPGPGVEPGVVGVDQSYNQKLVD